MRNVIYEKYYFAGCALESAEDLLAGDFPMLAVPGFFAAGEGAGCLTGALCVAGALLFFGAAGEEDLPDALFGGAVCVVAPA